jgi:hypothetical protein
LTKYLRLADANLPTARNFPPAVALLALWLTLSCRGDKMSEQFAVRHEGVDRDLTGALGPLEGAETVRSYNRLRRIEGQIRGL